MGPSGFSKSCKTNLLLFLHSASKNLCSFPLPQQPASAALDAERTTAKLNGKQVIEIDED